MLSHPRSTITLSNKGKRHENYYLRRKQINELWPVTGAHLLLVVIGYAGTTHTLPWHK